MPHLGYEAQIIYRIIADESRLITVKIQPRGRVPNSVPRIGLVLRLHKMLSMAEYIGLHRSFVKDLSTNCGVPQVNRNRMGPRRERPLDESGGTGLQNTRMNGEGKFAWAAGHYSP